MKCHVYELRIGTILTLMIITVILYYLSNEVKENSQELKATPHPNIPSIFIVHLASWCYFPCC